MNENFKSTVEALHPKFERLIQMTPVKVATIPNDARVALGFQTILSAFMLSFLDLEQYRRSDGDTAGCHRASLFERGVRL
jgi:hypothetical protein